MLNCKRCNCLLNIEGFCQDETCPFSQHYQDCLTGWTGHPEHPECTDKTKCTCGNKEQNMMQIINKKITLDLIGTDGNAFAIIEAFRRQARREKWTKEEIDAVLEKAQSDDYDNLLRTIMAHCQD